MRRIVALAAAMAASGSLTLAPSTARAEVVGVPLITDPSLSVQASAYASGTGCTLTGATGTDSYPLVVNGTLATHANVKSSTSTDGAGKLTALNRSVEARARATTRNGQLGTVDLRAGGFAQADPQPGQSCYATDYAAGAVTMDFTLTLPQWVSVTIESGRQTDAWAEAYEEDDGSPSFSFSVRGAGGSLTASRYLAPGTYEFDAGIGWGAYTDAGLPGQRREGEGSISVRLYDTGSATAAPAGSGRPYLTPGAAITCGAQTLPTTFTSRGGRVKSATFLVNGVRKKVVRNPVAGQKVTLSGMPKYRRNHVRVRLVVDPPGDVRTATVVSTRSYRACAPPL